MPLAAADSWDVFCAVSQNDAARGQAGAPALASVIHAISDATTPRGDQDDARIRRNASVFVDRQLAIALRARCATDPGAGVPLAGGMTDELAPGALQRVVDRPLADAQLAGAFAVAVVGG